MNIHEFQGKSLVQVYGVPVQEGVVAENGSHAETVAEDLRKKFGTQIFVIKAQARQDIDRLNLYQKK